MVKVLAFLRMATNTRVN